MTPDPDLPRKVDLLLHHSAAILALSALNMIMNLAMIGTAVLVALR